MVACLASVGEQFARGSLRAGGARRQERDVVAYAVGVVSSADKPEVMVACVMEGLADRAIVGWTRTVLIFAGSCYRRPNKIYSYDEARRETI